MGRFGCMMGRFGQCNGPFWTIFLEIKILGAVLVGAVLAMGRFGIDPTQRQFVFIFPFLQTSITSPMWPSGGNGDVMYTEY